jgi:ABC-type Co2+ transport system permease subunit
MSLPFAVGIFGLVVSLVFLFNSLREIRKNNPGHSLNAAKIHLAMVAMFIPFCIYILFAYAP